MFTLLIIVHVLVCLALIAIVLLQSGKGAEMGAAFGGSSQTVFGGAGPAPFLGKVTTGAAIVFMVTSLTLAYLSSNPFGGSVMDEVQTVTTPQQAEPVEALPEGGAVEMQATEEPAQPAPAAEQTQQ